MNKMKKFSISTSMVVFSETEEEAIEKFEDGLNDGLQYRYDSSISMPWDIKEEEPTPEELKELEE